MDPATVLGMLMALGALLVTMLLEGSDPTAIVLLPPLVLVFGARHRFAGSREAEAGELRRERFIIFEHGASIRRATAIGIGGPTPAACDSTRLRWSFSRSAASMRTLASFPKPVLMP